MPPYVITWELRPKTVSDKKNYLVSCEVNNNIYGVVIRLVDNINYRMVVDDE